MIARLEIGSAILQYANIAAGIFQTEMDHRIGISDAIPRFGCNKHCGASVRGESEEGLDEPPVIESIRGQLSKVIETVDKDALDVGIADRFRDFHGYGLALDFGRRK